MRRNLIFTFAALIVTLSMIFLAIVPQFNEALELRGQIANEKPKLEKLNQKLLSLESASYAPEFAKKELVDQALPSKKPLLNLMVSLNDVANKSGAVIQSFELSPGMIATDSASADRNVVNQGDVDTLDVEMIIIGTDQSVQSFLDQIEKVAPFTTITKLSLGSLLGEGEINSNGNSDARRAEVSASTFFFTKPIVANVESPLPAIETSEQILLNNLAELIPTDLPDQTTIDGGGLEDIFGVDPLLFE